MTFTELRKINGKKYYYRVLSIRNGKKISKRRLYLGKELSNSELKKMEKEADEKLLFKRIDRKNKEIEKIKHAIIEILKANKINKAGIFGSYARGEQKKNSDVDIVININDKNMSLLDFIGIKLKLEDVLRKKVDLVEYSAIKPLTKNNILKEEVRII